MMLNYCRAIIRSTRAETKPLTYLRASSLASQKRTFSRTVSCGDAAPQKHFSSLTVDHADSPSLKQNNPFGDYRAAFGEKSTWELARTFTFFSICNLPGFAEHAFKVMGLSYKLLGKRLTNFMIRKTVYDQFVAGESLSEMSEAIRKLGQVGVNPILCCPIECYTENSSFTQDQYFDDNMVKILDSIDNSLELDVTHPMVQYRYTAFVCDKLLTSLSPLCESTMHDQEVLSGLVAAMEGKDVDFSQLPGWQTFPTEKKEEFSRGLRRIGKINEALQRHDIIALADAEYTYMNPALRQIGLCSMIQCNKGVAKVFHTYQAYLRATLSTLSKDLQFCKSQGLSLGVKLVRGAYMVQERKRASDLGYPDPVNPNFEATSQSYSSCLDLLMNELDKSPKARVTYETEDNKATPVRFIVASHNEDSVLHAMGKMEELGIAKDGGVVFFGQLYGMRDNVSIMLGKNGYSVYKSIPYGSIDETLPYLSRRAQENKSILENVKREKKMVRDALRDRILLRQ